MVFGSFLPISPYFSYKCCNMMRCCSKDKIDLMATNKAAKPAGRELYHVCPSKLSKRELEDLYFRLLQNNLDLKKTINQQSEKNKLLSTKLQRMTITQKTYLGKERDCCATKGIVLEQRHVIQDLKRTNEQLKEQVKQLNMKLCSTKQFLKGPIQVPKEPVLMQNKASGQIKPVNVDQISTKNASTSALNTNTKEEIDIKKKSVSCQCLDKIGMSSTEKPSKSISTATSDENRCCEPVKQCDENKCRTLMEELKLKIVNLQEELTKTHGEYFERITRLEQEVKDLHSENIRERAERAIKEENLLRRENEAKEIKQKLTESQCEYEQLAAKLNIEKSKVAELEAQVKSANMTSEAVKSMELRLGAENTEQESQKPKTNGGSDFNPTDMADKSPTMMPKSPTETLMYKSQSNCRCPNSCECSQVSNRTAAVSGRSGDNATPLKSKSSERDSGADTSTPKKLDDSGFTDANKSATSDEEKECVMKTNKDLISKIADLTAEDRLKIFTSPSNENFKFVPVDKTKTPNQPQRYVAQTTTPLHSGQTRVPEKKPVADALKNQKPTSPVKSKFTDSNTDKSLASQKPSDSAKRNYKLCDHAKPSHKPTDSVKGQNGLSVKNTPLPSQKVADSALNKPKTADNKQKSPEPDSGADTSTPKKLDDSGFTDANKSATSDEEKGLMKINKELISKIADLQSQLDQLRITMGSQYSKDASPNAARDVSIDLGKRVSLKIQPTEIVLKDSVYTRDQDKMYTSKLDCASTCHGEGKNCTEECKSKEAQKETNSKPNKGEGGHQTPGVLPVAHSTKTTISDNRGAVSSLEKVRDSLTIRHLQYVKNATNSPQTSQIPGEQSRDFYEEKRDGYENSNFYDGSKDMQNQANSYTQKFKDKQPGSNEITRVRETIASIDALCVKESLTSSKTAESKERRASVPAGTIREPGPKFMEAHPSTSKAATDVGRTVDGGQSPNYKDTSLSFKEDVTDSKGQDTANTQNMKSTAKNCTCNNIQTTKAQPKCMCFNYWYQIAKSRELGQKQPSEAKPFSLAPDTNASSWLSQDTSGPPPTPENKRMSSDPTSGAIGSSAVDKKKAKTEDKPMMLSANKTLPTNNIAAQYGFKPPTLEELMDTSSKNDQKSTGSYKACCGESFDYGRPMTSPHKLSSEIKRPLTVLKPPQRGNEPTSLPAPMNNLDGTPKRYIDRESQKPMVDNALPQPIKEGETPKRTSCGQTPESMMDNDSVPPNSNKREPQECQAVKEKPKHMVDKAIENRLDICEDSLHVCTCTPAARRDVSVFRSCSGTLRFRTTDANGRFRKCDYHNPSCGDSLKTCGTQPQNDEGIQTQEQLMNKNPDSKTNSVGGPNTTKHSRAISPENTDQEISHLSDLPSEKTTPSGSPRSHKCSSRSPGEDKATATYTDSGTTPLPSTATPIPMAYSLSEGELPQPYQKDNDRRISHIEPRSTEARSNLAESSTAKVEQALQAITEELARCRWLLHRKQSQEKLTLKKSESEDSVAMAAAPPALSSASPHLVYSSLTPRESSNISLHPASARPQLMQSPRVMFTLHIGTVVLSDEAVINSKNLELVLTWQFYDQHMTMSHMRPGRVVNFDYSTEYDLKLTDQLLEYLKSEELIINVCEAVELGNPLASCSLPLREALLHTNKRADMSLALVAGPRWQRAVSADALDTRDEMGVLDLWCMLRAETRFLPKINKAISKSNWSSAAKHPARGGALTTQSGPIMAQINEDDQDDVRLSADLDPMSPTRLPIRDSRNTFDRGMPRMSEQRYDQGYRDSSSGVFLPYSAQMPNSAGKVAKRTSGAYMGTSHASPLNMKTNQNSTRDINTQVNFDGKSSMFEGQRNLSSGIIVNEVPTSIKSTKEMKEAMQKNLMYQTKPNEKSQAGRHKKPNRDNLDLMAMATGHSSNSLDVLLNNNDNKNKGKNTSRRPAEAMHKKRISDLESIRTQGTSDATQLSKKYDDLPRMLGSKKAIEVFNKKVKIIHDESPAAGTDVLDYKPSEYLQRGKNQTLDITIQWLALNEECAAMNDPSVQRLYVAYNFLGRGGAELETPMSLPKPKQYQDKCYFNFKKTFQLTDADRPTLGRMAKCRSQGKGTPNPTDFITFVVVSEPVEDPLGLNNCEDIGTAHLFFGDLLAYSAGSDSYTEVVPVRAAQNDDSACGVLSIRVDGLEAVRRCQNLRSSDENIWQGVNY